MRIAVLLVILISVVGGGAWIYKRATDHPAVEYKTTAVKRGDVVASISASGTLEPIETIDVGAQVAGQIEFFGKDLEGNLLDNNSKVDAGMLLAKIDDTVYKADVDVAAAQLAQANTAILKAQADYDQAKAKLFQTENDWKRAQDLGPSDALSQNDYDMYQADYLTAKANVAIAESEIAQAKNGVPLAQAELDKAKRNLDFCTITSPVKGMILDRRVNVGQTVVSSLSTPSLFLIARDLTKMQIWASVNEADVEHVTPGSAVTFTCEGLPDQVFKGKVGKVRNNATMNQNVVLYTVEVNVDNPNSVLRPYKTAKIQFEVARDSDALVVPNMALRWVPASTEQISPDARASAADENSGEAKSKDHHGIVWIKDGSYVRPVSVKLGATDRINTAVFSDKLKEGDAIIVGDVAVGGDAATVKNPFMPPEQSRHH